MHSIIGHRGCSSAPENTMAAFRKAYADGARAVELDIHLSKDEEMVVIHDSTLDRTTDGQGFVADFTWEELQGFDAGWGQHLPRLDEVLDWSRATGCEVYVEIKDGRLPADFAQRLVDKVRGSEDRIHVISFNREAVEQLEKLDPALDTGVLLAPEPILDRVKTGAAVGATVGLLGGLVGVALGAGIGALAGLKLGQREEVVDALSLRGQVDTVLPYWIGLNGDMIDQIGMRTIAYTADAPPLVRHLLAQGCAGVITDNPERFV